MSILIVFSLLGSVIEYRNLTIFMSQLSSLLIFLIVILDFLCIFHQNFAAERWMMRLFYNSKHDVTCCSLKKV